jgi:hypothetical protein
MLQALKRISGELRASTNHVNDVVFHRTALAEGGEPLNLWVTAERVDESTYLLHASGNSWTGRRSEMEFQLQWQPHSPAHYCLSEWAPDPYLGTDPKFRFLTLVEANPKDVARWVGQFVYGQRLPDIP